MGRPRVHQNHQLHDKKESIRSGEILLCQALLEFMGDRCPMAGDRWLISDNARELRFIPGELDPAPRAWYR